MKLLKVLRSECTECPGLKILTNSRIFRALHHNKLTPKWEESEFIDPKAKIMYVCHGNNCTEPDTLLDHSLFSIPSLLSTLTQCKGEPLTGH